MKNIPQVTSFKDVLALLGLAIVWLVRQGVKTVIFVSDAINLLRSAKLGLAVEHNQFGLPSAGLQNVNRSASAQTADFVAATSITTVRLDPAVAVIHLRFYESLQSVSCELVVVEPRLSRMIGKRCHNLGDQSWSLSDNKAALIDGCVEKAQKLINDAGDKYCKLKPAQVPKAVSQAKPVKAEVPTPPKPIVPKSELDAPKAQAAQLPKDPVPTAPKAFENKPAATVARANELAPRADTAPQAQSNHQKFVPTQNVGVTFEGELVFAAPQTHRPVGRPPYEVFNVKLRLDNGASIPMRGAELERELSAQHIKLGDRIAITPRGKIPVTIAGGESAEKNVYEVRVVERTKS